MYKQAEKATGIKINVNVIPESDYSSKLNQMVATKDNSSDIFVVWENDIKNFAEIKGIVPLDSYLEKSSVNQNDFIDAVMNLFMSGSLSTHIHGEEVTLKVDTKFPFDGKVNITMEGNMKKDFQLAIRIPNYVSEYSVTMNKTEIEKTCNKGYLYITIERESNIVVDFKLEPKFIRANPNVREDSGKVALMKGPLVYCIEEIDNGKNLPAYFVHSQSKMKEEYIPELLGGTNILKIKGKKIKESNWEDGELYKETELQWEDRELIAVPYCYWGNRVPGEMLVWMKELLG